MAVDRPQGRRRVTVAELQTRREDLARIGTKYGVSWRSST